MSLIEDQKEKDRHEEAKALNKRYAKRKNGKALARHAERQIFADDILQPYQPMFKQRWYKAWKDRQLMYDAVDREVIRKEKEIEEAYRKKIKNVVTLEQKILKDVQLEHPTMIEDSDIIKHSST